MNVDTGPWIGAQVWRFTKDAEEMIRGLKLGAAQAEILAALSALIKSEALGRFKRRFWRSDSTREGCIPRELSQ